MLLTRRDTECSIKMKIILITTVVQILILPAIHSQFVFDFIPMFNEEEEEGELNFFEEVLIDPFYEFRFCSNEYEHQKLLSTFAWAYIVEVASKYINVDSLKQHEFLHLRAILENFVEDMANCLSKVEVESFKFKFFDINVANNVTDEELLKIISSYYYKENVIANKIVNTDE